MSSQSSNTFRKLVQSHTNSATRRGNQLLGAKDQQARDVSAALGDIMDQHRDGVEGAATEAKQKMAWKKIQGDVQEEIARTMGLEATDAKARKAAEAHVQGMQSAWQKSVDTKTTSSARRGGSPIASRSGFGSATSRLDQQSVALRQDATPTVRGQKLSYSSDRGASTHK